MYFINYIKYLTKIYNFNRDLHLFVFDRFPNNPSKRKPWLYALGMSERSFLQKYTYVCSEHFHVQDFVIKPSGVRYLRDGAIPSVPSTSRVTEAPEHFRYVIVLIQMNCDKIRSKIYSSANDISYYFLKFICDAR